MLAQNTFLLKQTEQWNMENTFISILSPQLLEYIDKSSFDKNLIFTSTPGAGKTTLLKTFSPEVLIELQRNAQNEKYAETFKLLKKLDVIDEYQVKLISATVFCARENYSMIDDIYDDANAVAVFFSLLSLRVIRKVIDAIMTTCGMDATDKKQINFRSIPQEYQVLLKEHFQGQELYDWSLREERKLCQSLSEMEDISGNALYNNLSVFKLFENDNVFIDDKPIQQRIMIMFDDIHALSQMQREALRNTVFRLRPRLTIWMTERAIGLNDSEIFGTEGRCHREYTIVDIDKIIQDKNKRFKYYKALTDVADRRVALTYQNEKLGDRLESSLDGVSDAKLKGIIDKIKKKVDAESKNTQNFQNICQYIQGLVGIDLLTQAKCWRVLLIMIQRFKQENTQNVMPFFNVFSEADFEKTYKNNHKIAEYYISLEYNLPRYCGIDTLNKLSSCNVEQFLDFAGEIFECRIALEAMPRSRKKLVSAVEQERTIKACVEEKWEDIRRNFSFGEDVQRFLTNIAEIGKKSLELKTASYASGTQTGIGVRMQELSDILNDEQYSYLLMILRNCVANNLLSCTDVKQGEKGTDNKVFYLNRWICVKFDLPLEYGGWKLLGADKMQDLLTAKEE